ncbi:MAG: hypothetical protein GY754_04415 [bacterium]|nr:hypothetical protein [bacterium]
MKAFLSEKKHNESLCELMRTVTMPGDIELSYARDPDFFHGLDIQGKFNQIGTCADGERITGIGTRSVKPMYINGEPMDFGYLSGLRAVNDHRGGITLKIFTLLNEVHNDKRAKGYINTIVDDNNFATAALASGRPGMPKYLDWGKYFTYAINLNKRRKPRVSVPGISLSKGSDTTLEEIVDFINTQGKKKQFFPVFTVEDFKSEYTRDFNSSDFYVARKDGEIVGVIGKWDQSKYKQNIVRGYHGYMKYLRPFINTGFRIAGYKPLPNVGNQVKMFYLSFVAIKENNVDIFSALLEQAYLDNKDGEYNYCLAGFHEDDPLREAASSYWFIPYNSRLFLVSWEGDIDFCSDLNRDMIPYLEVGTL